MSIDLQKNFVREIVSKMKQQQNGHQKLFFMLKMADVLQYTKFVSIKT